MGVKLPAPIHEQIVKRKHSVRSCSYLPPETPTLIFSASGFDIGSLVLTLFISDKSHLATAVTEMQIWVPANYGPYYEVKDGLLCTFISALMVSPTQHLAKWRSTAVNREWVELLHMLNGGEAVSGDARLTIIGGGHSNVTASVNCLINKTVAVDGRAEEQIPMPLLAVGNLVGMSQAYRTPWLDVVVLR